MKRILKGACIVAMVALAFTSCKKKDNATLSFVATTEDIEVVNDDRVYINPQNQLAFEIDERLASLRFVDQPGQWVNTTPPDVKKRQEKAWEKLAKMMEEKK